MQYRKQKAKMTGGYVGSSDFQERKEAGPDNIFVQNSLLTDSIFYDLIIQCVPNADEQDFVESLIFDFA